MDTIEIQFGAKDFETLGIPEGFTAKIEDGKIIVKKEETEDERIRKAIVHLLEVASEAYLIDATGFKKEQFLSYLEKQKEQKLSTLEDIAAAYQLSLATGRKEQKSVKDKFIEDTISYLNGGMCFSNSMEELKYRSNLAYGLRSLRPPQDRCKDCPHRGDMFLLTQGFKSGKHELAIRFMNYLDENRPEDKMGLSNSECEDIDKAFNENDWNKIIRYIEKYKPHWKPSEEQMKQLYFAADLPEFGPMVTTRKQFPDLGSLYEQLKKLM